MSLLEEKNAALYTTEILDVLCAIIFTKETAGGGLSCMTCGVWLPAATDKIRSISCETAPQHPKMLRRAAAE
jgi:hypothetical protein